MLLDQLLFAPFFLSTFIASLMTLEVSARGWARLVRAGGAQWGGAGLPQTHAQGSCERAF